MACKRSSVQVRYPPLIQTKAVGRKRSTAFFVGVCENSQVVDWIEPRKARKPRKRNWREVQRLSGYDTVLSINPPASSNDLASVGLFSPCAAG